MADSKSKSKAAMLIELESIKGLLKEEDDIPILQEVIDPSQAPAAIAARVKKASEQQDFFGSQTSLSPESSLSSISQLLDTLNDLEKVTADVASNKNVDKFAAQQRPALAKATGENPFLPQHIRSRLHGNNPPPLFEIEAARKIASVSQPKTQLGNTQSFNNPSQQTNHRQLFTAPKISASQQALIDKIMDNLLPEIERELRERLEVMTKDMLENLLANK